MAGETPARVVDGLVLDAGKVLDLGTLWLGEAGTLEGRVVNLEGRGMAAAEIRVLQGRFTQEQILEDFVGFLTRLDREPTAVGTGEADASGRFRIEGLPPGKITVIARVPGHHQAIQGAAMTAEGAVGGPLVLRVSEAEPLVGRVLDSGGQGVAGARLAFLDQRDDEFGFVGRHFVETGDDGRFRADAPPRARELVAIVTAEGYPTLFAELGAARDDLVFTLRGGATLHLRFVFDDSGRPVPGAAVVAMVSENEGMGEVGTFLTGITDDDGRIELDALPGFVGMVMLQHPEHGSSLYSPQAGMMMGGGLLIEGPEKLQLTEGRNEVELRVPRGVFLHGTVRDTEGEAVAGAVVSTSGGPFGIGKGIETVTDDEGRYRFIAQGVGMFRVHAEAAGYVQDPTTHLVERPEGKAEIAHDITMLTAARVEGMVVDPKGAPAAGIEVEIRRDATGADVSDGAPMPMGDEARARSISDGRGRYVIEDVAPRTRYVVVGRGEGFVVSQSEPFSVAEAGARTRAPRLQLTRGAAIDVEVIDAAGEPLRGADVEVRVERKDGLQWSSRDAWTPFVQLVTDGSGKARVQHLPDGEITIVAHGAEAAPARARLEVENGQAQPGPVLLRLRPSTTLRGRVVDQHGAPAARGFVSAGTWVGQGAGENASGVDDANWMPHQSTRTDEEGRFALDHVPVGARFELAFYAEGYDPATVKVEDVWSEVAVVVNKIDPEIQRRKAELRERMMAVFREMASAESTSEREALQAELQAIQAEMGRLQGGGDATASAAAEAEAPAEAE